jgi:glutathione S-transferase
MELIGISISPFSDRAKWALDHHRLPYKYSEHVVIFGEPSLRWKLRRFTGGVTAPALIDGKTRLMDSWDIARYADERGAAPKLFPEALLDRIQEWNSVSEELLDDSRVLMSKRISGDAEAKRAMLPAVIPTTLRGPLQGLVNVGMTYLAWSFKYGSLSMQEREARLRANLTRIREATRERDYLVGDQFTYADVTIACGLQGISPVKGRGVAKNEAIRRAWTDPELSQEFRDVLSWRDKIVIQHMPKQSSRLRKSGTS